MSLPFLSRLAGRGSRATWLPLTASLGALVVSVLFWQSLLAAERRAARQTMEARLAAVERVVLNSLEERTAALAHMARRWKNQGNRTRAEFDLEAQVLREGFPSFRALGWVSPRYRVVWVHPIQGTEAVLGIDINTEPTRAAAYTRARDTGRPAVTPPMDLVQGGRGILDIVPIDTPSGNAGFIYAAIDLDAMFNRVLRDTHPGFTLAVSVEGERAFTNGEPETKETLATRFDHGGLTWEVALTPKRAAGWAGVLPHVVFAVSAALSLMLGLALHGRMLATLRARQAEAAGRRYRTLFETVPVGIVMVEPEDSSLSAFNPAAAALLGYGPEEFAGKRLTDLIADMDSEMLLAVLRSGAGEVGQPQLDMRYRCKDGELIDILVTRRPVEDDGRARILAIWLDVTERKRAEREVMRLNRILEQRVEERTRQLADANAELQGFAHSIAHDLRAPLRTMRGFSQALLEDYGEGLDKTAADYLGRIADGAARMDRLILDLLAYSKISREELTLEPLDLDRAVSEAVRQLEAPLRDSRAELLVERPLPRVVAHRVVLVQLLVNLLSNAVKFVAQGTRPVVRIRAERREPDRVRIWVEDNGIGIAPEHQGRIFQVFQRLHGMTQYPGTGIGLAIVRRGAERMGEGAGVLSEPGRGSRFWIDIRAADGEGRA